VAPEYVTRHGLYQDLSLTHEPRLEVIQADAVYHQWGLSMLFLEESSQALGRDPEYALDLASTGLRIAQLLSEDFYSRPLVNDLIGKATMQVLEVQFQLGRGVENLSLLGRARVHLRWGTGRPELFAALDHLQSRVLTLLGANEEALRILDRGLRSSLEALSRSSRSPSGQPGDLHRFSLRSHGHRRTF
jgi:hypothetical protein